MVSVRYRLCVPLCNRYSTATMSIVERTINALCCRRKWPHTVLKSFKRRQSMLRLAVSLSTFSPVSIGRLDALRKKASRNTIAEKCLSLTVRQVDEQRCMICCLLKAVNVCIRTCLANNTSCVSVVYTAP